MINYKEDYKKTTYDYIYKHKNNGTYAVQFNLFNKVYNKRAKIRKINFKTIKEAQDFIADERIKFKNQEEKMDKHTTFSKAFSNYIEECKIEVKKGNLSKSTVRGKETIFKNQILPVLGRIKINEIREEHILKFHDDLLSMKNLKENDKTLSNQTLIKIHKQLSAFLNYCVRKKLLLYNPAGRVGNFKKVKIEKEYLTYQEFMNLMFFVDDIRDYFILMLLFNTGIRIGELLGITKDNIVTTEAGTSLTINKTYYNGEIRYKAKTEESIDNMYLDDITVKAYHEYIQNRKDKNIDSDFIFSHNKNIYKDSREDNHKENSQEHYKILSDRAVRDMIKKYLKLANIDKNITPHKFRHSHAALLISLGKQLEDIKTRLRHKDIRTTSNDYGHMYQEKKISLANDLTNFFEENRQNSNF